MDTLLSLATPLLVVSLALTAAMVLLLPTRHRRDGDGNGGSTPRIAVLVLGDLGRSPRMQYHALSIARRGAVVDLIGYKGSDPRPELLNNPNVNITPLPDPPKFLDTSTPVRFILFAPLKALWQLLTLWRLLMYTLPPTVGYILVQNPPSFPTLILARCVGALRGIKVVIDWHNFGWTILRLKLRQHPIVYLLRFYEYTMSLGTLGLSHQFTVSHSMTRHLQTHTSTALLSKLLSLSPTPITTLHDRPPIHFTPLTSSARSTFLHTHPTTSPHATSILTGKTKLLITSTSWTADEDFTLLLSSLLFYDRHASAHAFLHPTNPPPRILAIITGRGDLRNHYLSLASQYEFQHVDIQSVWLEAEDYPLMIGAADLGVSLHTSSSGLDLPMKIVDLMGVGVPVVAVRYAAVGELVRYGVNGITVEDGGVEGEGREMSR
ncbi:hypothetical protein EX30DRAFT_316315, partial [Ascodesmis nigricans]